MRRFCRRHAGELGALRSIHAHRPGPFTVGIFVIVWALFAGLTLVRPPDQVLMAITPALVFALLGAILLVMLSGERLAVCERGLVVGSIAPGLQPFVIPFDRIVPGSIVPVTGATRYAKETGAQVESTARIYWWTRHAVYFVGPSPQDARRFRARLGRLLDPPPRTVDGRWCWIVGVREDPATVTARIADAAAAAGLPQLAAATAAAPVRRLTGRPEDAASQLPGLPDTTGRPHR